MWEWEGDVETRLSQVVCVCVCFIQLKTSEQDVNKTLNNENTGNILNIEKQIYKPRK